MFSCLWTCATCPHPALSGLQAVLVFCSVSPLGVRHHRDRIRSKAFWESPQSWSSDLYIRNVLKGLQPPPTHTPFPRDWSQIDGSKVLLDDIKLYNLHCVNGKGWSTQIMISATPESIIQVTMCLFCPPFSWTGCLHCLFKVWVQPREHWVLGGLWGLQENAWVRDASQCQADFQTVRWHRFPEWGETASHTDLLY